MSAKGDSLSMRPKMIRLFFKFNKYSFIELLWILIGLLCSFLVIKHWTIKGVFSDWRKILYLSIWIAVYLFGVFRCFMSFKTSIERVRSYYRIKRTFIEHGVKKSLLYSLSDTPCTKTIADQLAKDFNIKLDRIKD